MFSNKSLKLVPDFFHSVKSCPHLLNTLVGSQLSALRFKQPRVMCLRSTYTPGTIAYNYKTQQCARNLLALYHYSLVTYKYHYLILY